MQKLGFKLSEWAERYLPDPFLLAVLLTLVSVLLALFLTETTPVEAAIAWRGGLWDLLAFAMQMSLILVCGHSLAAAPICRIWIERLAALPSSGRQAVGLVALIAVLSGLFNWGLSLVFSALLARTIVQRFSTLGVSVHYPVLGTAAYLGLAVWHGGFSGSAPLTVATQGHSLQESIGLLPVSQTLLSPLNIVVALSLCVLLPAYLMFLMPVDQIQGSPAQTRDEEPAKVTSAAASTPAARLENSRFFSLFIGSFGLMAWLHFWFVDQGGLNLNSLIAGVLFLGIMVHPGLKSYLQAFQDGVQSCAGILLQFPLYAGIMGIFRDSGLLGLMGETLIEHASAIWFPVLVFYSAALVNVFVPSGGGQWAVQGPLVMEVASQLGVEPSKAVLALSYGDQWTNLCQPFWALALLGITGLKARDIMGWCLMILLPGLILFPFVLLIF